MCSCPTNGRKWPKDGPMAAEGLATMERSRRSATPRVTLRHLRFAASTSSSTSADCAQDCCPMSPQRAQHSTGAQRWDVQRIRSSVGSRPRPLDTRVPATGCASVFDRVLKMGPRPKSRRRAVLGCLRSARPSAAAPRPLLLPPIQPFVQGVHLRRDPVRRRCALYPNKRRRGALATGRVTQRRC